MKSPGPHVDFVALSLLPSQWRLQLGEQLRRGASPADLLGRLCASRPSRVRTDGGREPRYEAAFLKASAARALERAARASLTVVYWSDEGYPPALATITDPPPVLWMRGSVEALGETAVALVGSRAASAYGLAVAERLGAELASRGVVVVSGLARGIDSAAHRGALSVGGRTVAVLGSGCDVVYPAEHASLASEIEVDGAVVSELPPGTPPRKWCFPLRNRIISGLSRAVVVIEAGDRSGSLITARTALEQGRDVLAVPGNVLSGRNRGGHALLRDGAKIVESADDIFDELGLAAFPVDPSRRGSVQNERREDIDPLLSLLPVGEACHLDELAERSGLSPQRLLSRLLDLELRGCVRRAGGGRFLRM